MRTSVIALIVMASVAVACSDRVPAPATPTPSPRPGYPPAPSSELPEGVLYVSKPDVLALPLFRFEAGREAEKIGAMVLGPVSPDGSRAVAQIYDGKSVTGVGLMTGAQYGTIVRGRWLMGAPWFVWSNDGRRLAYVLPAQTDSATASIWALDTESGEKMLLTEEAGSFWIVGWTAAGDILMRAPDGLALLGKTRRPIALPEPGSVLDAQISPDGRSVAIKLGEYEQDPQTEVVYIHTSGIWVLHLRNSQWREIVELEGEPPVTLTTAGDLMRWSPDARRLAYHSPIGPGWPYDRFGLDVVDVVTGDLERLVDRPVWTEAWSADGRYLAYLYENPAAERRLGIFGPDGRTRETDILARRLAWTKGGRLLVDIPGHLSLLDPATMELNEVQTESGEAIGALLEAPVWSPSGRYFALSTPADMYHRSSLYVIDTEDGTAEVFLDEAGFAPVAWLRE